MKHIYYRLNIKLESPMSIGSGKEKNTDSDIVLTSKGEPYIPGTSLAGIYRSLFEQKDKEKFFGYIKKEICSHSPIIVYDGKCRNYSKGYISNRDSVELDNYKTAKDGAKFDFEIAETGLEFVSYIELDKNHAQETETAVENIILPALNSGKITLGHKTSRGYGKVSVTCHKKEFDIKTQLDEWLDFDMFDDDKWSCDDKINIQEYMFDGENIKIPLAQKGAVSIRRYVTDRAESEKESIPDYEQLTLKNADPVIPGTSWAGAFRHRIRSCGICEDKINKLFGYINKTKEAKNLNSQKSKIHFSETILHGGEPKIITRNSIDRFSAETKEGALFTEKTYYNGKTVLEIRINKDIEPVMKKLVYACIVDLCEGYLAVGGLTAVGHGIFELEKGKKITVNGEEADFFEKLKGGSA